MTNVENLKPFPKFCYTIGMIPTSYKESLTYEEQLMWFCDFLQNTVIPTVNNNGQAVQELQNLYIELKSYVDNYFNNLDVQEEINNKLDQMVENGTLQNIIYQYIKLQALFCYDTVNDMKNATNLINGSYVKTYGFYEKNDGGGAFYKIREITNQDVVNNMNLIALSNDNSLVAELMTDIVNVLQFGAKGNNETDDTLVFQTASNYASSHNLKFYVPNKIFLIDTITLNNIKYINIEGEINFVDDTKLLNIFESTTIYACNIYINKVNNGTIILKGLNTADVNIQRAKKLTLLADNTEDHHWIAYSKFYLGFINTLNIIDDGSGTKYINENLFIGGRLAYINIGTENSNYKHENNLFLKPLCEDTVMVLGYARANIFQDARFEGPTASITFTENSLANVIYQEWNSTNVGYWTNKDFVPNNITITDNSNGRNAFIHNRGIKENLITNINITNNPRNMLTEGDDLKPLMGKIIWSSDYFKMPNVECALICNSKETHLQFRVMCYNENKELITNDPNLMDDLSWQGVSWDNTLHCYKNTLYTTENYIIMIKPNTNIKYLKFEVFSIETGVRYNFDNIKITLNSYENINPLIIDMARKYLTE